MLIKSGHKKCLKTLRTKYSHWKQIQKVFDQENRRLKQIWQFLLPTGRSGGRPAMAKLVAVLAVDRAADRPGPCSVGLELAVDHSIDRGQSQKLCSYSVDWICFCSAVDRPVSKNEFFSLRKTWNYFVKHLKLYIKFLIKLNL